MIPSPYGRQRPRTTRASIAASASATSRDLPTPASPTTVTSSQRDCACARSHASRSAPARARGRRTASAWLRSGASSTETSRNAGTGSDFPFNVSGSTGSATTASWTSACVASPINTSPGAAACSNRAATFTASPVTRRSAVPVTTSPVFTPIRPRIPERRQRVAHLHRRPASPQRIVLVRRGTPNTAITASPMNFSTVPPCDSTIPLIRSK